MAGIPNRDEAPPYYFQYIDRISNPDVVAELERQGEETLRFLGGVGEEKSTHRYAPEKWSVRQVLGHVNDCERLFLFRAFWFARALGGELPSFDEKPAALTARSDDFSWKSHVEEFASVRDSALRFFRRVRPEEWDRTGIASGYSFSVRALAYIAAGHVSHHTAILRERYL